MPFRHVSLTALLLAGVATPALAEDAAPAGKAEDKADIVVTAQKANQTQIAHKGDLGALGTQNAADVPFSIKSYNAALILNQQPQTLGQVLENDPSIRTTYGFGNAAEQFVIRGFVLYGDDVGLNGLYGIAPRQLIAPELYDQVQVLNGASAFLNGAAPGGSGLGGSVNLVTKTAGDRPLTRVTANYTSKGHVGGSFDLSRRSDDGRWGFRLNGVARAGDVSIDDEYRSTYVAGLAVDYRSDAIRIALDANYQHVTVDDLRPKVTILSATIPAVPKASHNYGQKFTYTKLRDIFGTLRVDWDVAPNASFYLRAGARDGAEKGVYGGINVTNAVTGAATGTALYVPRTDNNEAATVGFRAKLGTKITQAFNLGLSGDWQVNRNAFDFLYNGPLFPGFATNLYNTTQVARPTSSLVGGNLAHPFPISRTWFGSAFASDTVGFLDDRILITGGLRLQTIKQTGYSSADGSVLTVYEKSAVTPVAGIVVKPVAGLSLFANRIEALQQGPTAPTDPSIANQGAVFAPYRTVQYEAGAKFEAGKVNASVAVYQTKLPTAISTPIPGTGLSIYGLSGEQRNRGIEFSMDGEVTHGLRIIAGGSINDARLQKTAGGTQNGNRAVGVPTYNLNGNIEWDVPFVPKLTLTGRIVQTGRQQVNTANTLSIPAWTRGDVGVRYVMLMGDKPVTLRATIDNVANNRYWASAFDSFSQSLLQGAPRTFKLSGTIDF